MPSDLPIPYLSTYPPESMYTIAHAEIRAVPLPTFKHTRIVCADMMGEREGHDRLFLSINYKFSLLHPYPSRAIDTALLPSHGIHYSPTIVDAFSLFRIIVCSIRCAIVSREMQML